MAVILPYLKCFLVGGALCAIGQLLIDRTNLTPARILTIYVVLGVALSAVGLYEPLVDFAGAGATVPLTGFGHTLAKGVREAVAERGWYALTDPEDFYMTATEGSGFAPGTRIRCRVGSDGRIEVFE